MKTEPGTPPKKPTIRFLQEEIKTLEKWNDDTHQKLLEVRRELEQVYAKIGREALRKLL